MDGSGPAFTFDPNLSEIPLILTKSIEYFESNGKTTHLYKQIYLLTIKTKMHIKKKESLEYLLVLQI